MSRIVLSVDDSADDLMLLTLACGSAHVGFRFESVQSARSAIAYLQGSEQYADRARFPQPDLVLLDLKMPGGSGFEVLEWIRRHPELSPLPVIVFTSSIQPEDRAQARAMRANDYWVKPVGYDELQNLMRTLDSLLTGPLPCPA